jgi:acetyl esterase
MGAPTLAERIQSGIAGFVTALPPAVLRLLAGGRPIRIDGQELAPEVQLGLLLMRLGGNKGVEGQTPEGARTEIARSTRFAQGPVAPVARVEPREIPGPAGPIPARFYVPANDGRRRALLVFYHGGGWVVGDLDTHDGLCRFLAREADVAVLAVDYRLAPEHKFPAAVEDAIAAFAWAAREADGLGVDGARIAVGGDSAGGTLSAVVSQQALRTGSTKPAAQLLIYPLTDWTTKRPSYRLFGEGFPLTAGDTEWFLRHYLPDEAAARDVRVSPILAESLAGLPPAVVVTAGFDVLRDEGEAYAERLRAAGVRVELRRASGLVHGFANATGTSPTARAAMTEAAHLLAALLGPPPR